MDAVQETISASIVSGSARDLQARQIVDCRHAVQVLAPALGEEELTDQVLEDYEDEREQGEAHTAKLPSDIRRLPG